MKKLIFLLAPAALLASCSSEPSDWRPDKKVSLDQIAPGTRPTDNFDQGTEAAPNQAKGAAITKPISSAVEGVDRRRAPTANEATSANTQAGLGQRRGEGPAGKRIPGDSPAPDTAQGQAGARRQ